VLGEALAVQQDKRMLVDPAPYAHLASWWKVSRNSRINSRPSFNCSSMSGS
jgi:hypothetical protein